MKDRTRQGALPGFDANDETPPVGEGRGDGKSEIRNPKSEISSSAFRPPPSALCPPLAPTASLSGQTVWVIDAHSLIHQVFHALPEMTSPRGEPVGAVFGFTRDLLYLLEEKRPDYLFAAFDLPGKTFRHAMYDQYKIQRAEMPEDLVPQIPAIRRVIAALGIPALCCESYEADDVLATVARVTEQLDGQCFIVTADKDCRQLITDRVKLFNIRKNEVFDRERLQAEWGIAPEQVVDFQALVGDSVDNVPGVPLVGPKFARQLLEQYGTLEAVLDHAGDVPGAKRRENLQKFRDQALLSRDLVRLDVRVPIEIDWNAGRPGHVDLDAALALFHAFGFRSIGQRVVAWAAARGERRGERGEGEDKSEIRNPKSEISPPPSALRPPPSALRLLPSPSPPTSSTPPKRSTPSLLTSANKSPSHSIPRQPVSGHVGQSWWACRSPGTTARRGICRFERRRASGISTPTPH